VFHVFCTDMSRVVPQACDVAVCVTGTKDLMLDKAGALHKVMENKSKIAEILLNVSRFEHILTDLKQDLPMGQSKMSLF